MIAAPPRLQDVRCPVSDHLLFRAAGQGTVIEIRCRCGHVVRVEGVLQTRIIADR